MYKSLLIGLVCASSAVHAETYKVNAHVVDVRPVYSQVTYSDPGYDTTYSWNGLTGVARTKKKYKRGTHMPVRISFN